MESWCNLGKISRHQGQRAGVRTASKAFSNTFRNTLTSKLAWSDFIHFCVRVFIECRIAVRYGSGFIRGWERGRSLNEVGGTQHVRETYTDLRHIRTFRTQHSRRRYPHPGSRRDYDTFSRSIECFLQRSGVVSALQILLPFLLESEGDHGVQKP